MREKFRLHDVIGKHGFGGVYATREDGSRIVTMSLPRGTFCTPDDFQALSAGVRLFCTSLGMVEREYPQ